MNFIHQLIAVISALIFLSSCGKKATSESSDSVNATEASIESGLAMVSGVADDQAGSSYASLIAPIRSPQIVSSLYRLALPQAQAIACSRAIVASCVSGVKSMSYSSCDLANSLFKLSGSVSLTFSQSDCSLTALNSTVIRTYNVDISGPRNGVFSQSSDVDTDYNNNSYGGGGKITKTSSGWDLEILGKRKSFTRNGRELFNVAVRTTSPIQVTGSLSRGSRVIHGGALEINHNLAKFTTTVVPNNLQYSSSCCHPVGGSLGISFSGSKTGTASVNFGSCGVATLVENGQSTALELSYCE